MRFRELELTGKKILTKAGVDSPGLCARLLTAYAAGMDKVAYTLSCEDEIPAHMEVLQRSLIKRRSSGEPLAYILGKKEFYKYEFSVSEAVLIPRPETELIVELALDTGSSDNIVFADVGCGSGCIGISLARERENWRGILMDISEAALAVARINSAGTSLRHVMADIFRSPLGLSRYDLIVSNPPYVSAGEAVMWETLAYEPHLALFSDNNGMAHLEALAQNAWNALKSGGRLIFEHGASQREAVKKILLASGFGECSFYDDLAGLPRCAMAVKN